MLALVAACLLLLLLAVLVLWYCSVHGKKRRTSLRSAFDSKLATVRVGVDRGTFPTTSVGDGGGDDSTGYDGCDADAGARRSNGNDSGSGMASGSGSGSGGGSGVHGGDVHLHVVGLVDDEINGGIARLFEAIAPTMSFKSDLLQEPTEPHPVAAALHRSPASTLKGTNVASEP